MQKPMMNQVAFARFSKDESPTRVNGGRGWTSEKATEYLFEHDMHADDLSFDSSYIRAKQYEPGRFIESDYNSEPEIGVKIIKAERRVD